MARSQGPDLELRMAASYCMKVQYHGWPLSSQRRGAVQRDSCKLGIRSSVGVSPSVIQPAKRWRHPRRVGRGEGDSREA